MLPQVLARVWLFGNARFDEALWELSVGGERRVVEAKPLALLHTLLCRNGEVATKDELLRTVWPGVTVTEGSLTTAVGKLRAALGPDGRSAIRAVHGMGYRIGVPVETIDAPVRPRPALAFAPGDTVPNRPQWRLERPLGGHGVWLVRHEKTGERRVFKFADTPERLEALKREVAFARILAGALGERADLIRPLEWNFETFPFSVESPFGGLDLHAWAETKGGLAAVPLAQRLGLVAAVARTVAAAHQVGILHRDIKPANILIDEAADGSPAHRLVDFGAGLLTEAARLQAAAISGLGMTRTGPAGDRREGTLRYMAPELLAGAGATVSSDVYALGILLYQIVVGDLDRPLAAGWEADIDDLLLRADIGDAASGKPDRRLQAASLLAERLETIETRRDALRDSERAYAEHQQMQRQIELARVRRPWLALAAVVLILGAVGTGTSAWRAHRAAVRATNEATLVTAENTFLADDLLARGNPARSGHFDETLIDAAVQAENVVDGRFAKAPLIAARLHAALAAAFEVRTAWTPARQAYDRAIADDERAEGPKSPDATLLLLRRIPLEARSFEPGAADRLHKFLAEARARLGDPRCPPAAPVLFQYDQGIEAEVQGRFDEAARLDHAAAVAAEAHASMFSAVEMVRFRAREAHALIRANRVSEALAILDQLQPREVRLLGLYHPETLTTVHLRTAALVESGRHAEALKLVDQTLPAFEAVLGPTQRDTIMMLGFRAVAERELGQYEASERDGLSVAQDLMASQGPRAFYPYAAMSDVALARCRGGKAASGVTTAEGAWRDLRGIAGDASPWTQLLAETTAFCLIADARGPEALAFLDRVDPHNLAEVESDRVQAQEPALMRADIAFAEGNVSQARALLAGPRRAFANYAIDPYDVHWMTRLASAVDAASDHPGSVRFASEAP